jgi:hypothetical protein
MVRCLALKISIKREVSSSSRRPYTTHGIDFYKDSTRRFETFSTN